MIVLTQKAIKFARLAELMGGYEKAVDRDHMKVMGICMRRNCDFIAEVVYTERGGLCPSCDDNTIMSSFVLADLV